MKTRYALFVLFVMALSVNRAIAQTQKECLENIGFESGTFNKWVTKEGTYATPTGGTTPVITLNPAGPVLNQHTITSGTGTDPNTNGNVTLVAPGGGRFSARIGDDNGQLSTTQPASLAEGVSYTINPVTKATAGLIYMYALVLEEAGGGTVHTTLESPKFEVVLTDNSTNPATKIPCGYYAVDAFGHKDLIKGKSNGMNGDWWYSKWTRVALDLTSFIGKSVTVEFRVNDCAPLQGGKYMSGTHAGYAYVDLMCEPIIVTSPIICADTKTVQICGPDGFDGYEWTKVKGDGTIAGKGDTKCITVNNPKPGDIFKVKLKTFGSSNCFSERIDTLRGFTIVAEKNLTLCPDKTPFFDLNAIPTPENGTRYKWSTFPLPPDVQAGTDTLKNPKKIPTPKQTTTYKVVAKDKDGCTATAEVTIKIACDIDVTLDPSEMCIGACATLEAKPSGGMGTIHYTWTPSPDPGNDDKPGPFKVCLDTTTIYTVTIKDEQGKTASDTAIVVINPKPKIKIRDTLICLGSSVTLTATGADKYTWKTPNAGDLTPLTGPVVVATPKETTTYTIIGETAKGCIDSTKVKVVVNLLPQLLVANKKICKGDSTTLTVTGALTYKWTSPNTPFDLSSSTGSTVLAKPTKTTTYTIVGEIAKGCVGDTTVTVTVNDQPLIDAGLPKTICLGDSAQLQATGGLTYKWSGVGIKNPTLANPWAVPVITTLYTVVGVDSNGCVGSDTVRVVVNPPVIMDVLPGGTICKGDSLKIGVTGDPTYTYLWEKADGLSSTSSMNPKASPAITTTYTVSASNGLCPPVKKTVTVNVNPVPKPKFTLDKYEKCVPLTVNFGNTSLDATGSTFTWYFRYPSKDPANVLVTKGLPVSHNYDTVGTFSIKLVVVSPGGCSDSLTYSDTVKTYPYPDADFNFTPEGADIWKPSITYFNKSTGEDKTKLKWYLDSDPTKLVSTKEDFIKIYPDAGTYNMCLSVVTTHGCPDEICKPVTITPDWSFFIPNAFSPNGDGKNEKFNGVGVNVIEYKMEIFDRWGLHICTINKVDTQDDRGNGWDGTVDGGSGEKQQEDCYVYKVQLTDIFHKKHYYVGRVTLIK